MGSPDYVDDQVFRSNFLLVPVFFRTSIPRSGGFSPEEGWTVSKDTTTVIILFILILCNLCYIL